MKRSFIRKISVFLIFVGMAIMALGPGMYAFNEGFGGPPGPLQFSAKWQVWTFRLLPLGVVISFGASVWLFILDRKSAK